MSEWYQANDEDIELDLDQAEVNIFVLSNDFGNVYVTMTWDQLDEAYRKKREHIEKIFNDAAVRLWEGKNNE